MVLLNSQNGVAVTLLNLTETKRTEISSIIMYPGGVYTQPKPSKFEIPVLHLYDKYGVGTGKHNSYASKIVFADDMIKVYKSGDKA